MSSSVDESVGTGLSSVDEFIDAGLSSVDESIGAELSSVAESADAESTSVTTSLLTPSSSAAITGSGHVPTTIAHMVIRQIILFTATRILFFISLYLSFIYSL